jgi:hypothetical protein
VRITVDDARRAGFCVSGLKTWAAENGKDFRSMIKDGITSEELIASGHEGIVDLVLKTQEK